MELSAAASHLVKALGGAAKPVQGLAEFDKSGTRREEELTQIALASEDLFSARFQAVCG